MNSLDTVLLDCSSYEIKTDLPALSKPIFGQHLNRLHGLKKISRHHFERSWRNL